MNYLVSVVVVFYCVSSFANPAVVDRVIGENDFVMVDSTGSNIPFRYRKIIDAFGFMDIGCTATHIGNGYVLTAGHCFWAPPTLVEDTPCDDVTVEWGYRKDTKPYLVSKCQRIVAAIHSNSMDFAVIKVSPIPPISIAPDLQRKMIGGDSLTVFSHADEQPLQWSGFCGSETIKDPQFSSELVQHKCDTNPGSSGATLLNLLTLKVVGIHDGGAEEGGVGIVNYGTYIMTTPLYEILKKLGFQ
ncbi:MAG: serine protease [Pseudobdellovibrio sp.]